MFWIRYRIGWSNIGKTIQSKRTRYYRSGNYRSRRDYLSYWNTSKSLWSTLFRRISTCFEYFSGKVCLTFQIHFTIKSDDLFFFFQRSTIPKYKLSKPSSLKQNELIVLPNVSSELKLLFLSFKSDFVIQKWWIDRKNSTICCWCYITWYKIYTTFIQ